MLEETNISKNLGVTEEILYEKILPELKQDIDYLCSRDDLSQEHRSMLREAWIDIERTSSFIINCAKELDRSMDIRQMVTLSFYFARMEFHLSNIEKIISEPEKYLPISKIRRTLIRIFGVVGGNFL